MADISSYKGFILVLFISVAGRVKGESADAPLSCLSCKKTVDLLSCTSNICDSTNDMCYMEKIFDRVSNRTVYNAGCTSKPCCNYNSSCCNTDTICRHCCSSQNDCNRHDCSDAVNGRPMTVCPVKSFQPQSKVTSPIECLLCEGATSPSGCNKTAVCGPNQVCYFESMEILNVLGIFESQYSAGCKDIKHCKENKCTNDVTTAKSNGFDAVRTVHHCCASHLCNGEALPFSDPWKNLCLACDGVQTTDKCSKLRQCGANETCSSSLIYPDANMKMECLPNQVCDAVSTSRSKRLRSGDVLFTRCCNGPLCNNRQLYGPPPSVLPVMQAPLLSNCEITEMFQYGTAVQSTFPPMMSTADKVTTIAPPAPTTSIRNTTIKQTPGSPTPAILTTRKITKQTHASSTSTINHKTSTQKQISATPTSPMPTFDKGTTHTPTQAPTSALPTPLKTTPIPPLPTSHKSTIHTPTQAPTTPLPTPHKATPTPSWPTSHKDTTHTPTQAPTTQLPTPQKTNPTPTIFTVHKASTQRLSPTPQITKTQSHVYVTPTPPTLKPPNASTQNAIPVTPTPPVHIRNNASTPYPVPVTPVLSLYRSTTLYQVPITPTPPATSMPKSSIPPTSPRIPTPFPTMSVATSNGMSCKDHSDVNCEYMAEINICSVPRLALKYCQRYCRLCSS